MRDRAAIAAHIGAEHPHLARARHHKAEQHGDGGGLAGAVAAKQSHRRGLGEAETDMVDGGNGAIDLGEVAHRHWHARLGARLCDAFARRLACTIYFLIHSFAKAFRFVGIMARLAHARLHLWLPSTIVKPSAAPPCPTGSGRAKAGSRLQTIVRLRWLAVLGQSLTVIGAYWVLGIDLPIGGCLAVIALSAWINVALRIRYPASQRLRSHYAFIMLGLRHSPARGAALSHRRAGEPVRLSAHRAGHGVGLDAAAQHHGRARRARHHRGDAADRSFIIRCPGSITPICCCPSPM